MRVCSTRTRVEVGTERGAVHAGLVQRHAVLHACQLEVAAVLTGQGDGLLDGEHLGVLAMRR